jgi:hypothetical protein
MEHFFCCIRARAGFTFGKSVGAGDFALQHMARDTGLEALVLLDSDSVASGFCANVSRPLLALGTCPVTLSYTIYTR